MDLRLILAAALLAFLLAGCSDSDGGDGAAGTGTDAPGDDGPSTGSGATGTGAPGGAGAGQDVDLAVAATGAYPVNPGFTPSELTVPAGARVHVTFSNEDLVPVVQHNWIVEGIADAGSDTIAPGGHSEFDFVAPAMAGDFTFYCAIGDHRARGMEGTLAVA
jgi:plastocyanin